MLGVLLKHMFLQPDFHLTVIPFASCSDSIKSLIGLGFPNSTILHITFKISLNAGWSLISLPFVQTNTSIQAVLSSIDGEWDYVYNPDTEELTTYEVEPTPEKEGEWEEEYTGIIILAIIIIILIIAFSVLVGRRKGKKKKQPSKKTGKKTTKKETTKKKPTKKETTKKKTKK